MRYMLMGLMLLLPTLAVGCGGNATNDAATDAQTDTADGSTPVCNAQAYMPNRPVFRDNAIGWDIVRVPSDRTEAVDFDGDGWTDVLVVRASATGDAPWAHLLRNLGNRFVDVTDASGLLATRSGTGRRQVQVAAWGDVDNDGDLDVFTGASTGRAGTETSELMLNQGNGTFMLSSGNDTLRMNSGDEADPSGASFVDVDLDGDIDLWVVHNNGGTASKQARLFVNDGSGQFTDGTTSLGLTTRSGSTANLNAGVAHLNSAWSGTACDLNGDGFAELLGASYGRAPNLLFQASRSGNQTRYTNRSIESGYAFDGNLEWWHDTGARCYCNFVNADAEGCENAEALPDSARSQCQQYLAQIPWAHARDTQVYRNGGNSGSTICNDLDNDGDMDLLTNEIRHARVGAGSDMAEILANSGTPDVTFVRPGREATGLTVPHVDPTDWDEGIITSVVFDFDNDGWSDIYMANGQYPDTQGMLFHQNAPLCFSRVPTRSDTLTLNRAGHGVVADFDRDGDLDLWAPTIANRCNITPNDTTPCNSPSNPRLFENQLSGNFIQLKLEGVAANRAAIGAVVRITAAGTTQTRVVSGGWGHYGEQGDLVVHAGLGSSTSAQIRITWPDANRSEQSFDVQGNQRYFVRQGMTPVASPRPMLIDAGIEDAGVDASTDVAVDTAVDAATDTSDGTDTGAADAGLDT